MNSQDKREKQLQFVRQLVGNTMQNLRTLKRMYDKQHELEFGSMELLDYFYQNFNKYLPRNPNAGNYARNDWVFNSQKLRGIQPENFMKQTKEDQLIAEAYTKVAKEGYRPIIVNGKEVEDIQVENEGGEYYVNYATFTDNTELTPEEIAELEKNYSEEIFNLGRDADTERAEFGYDLMMDR